MDLSGTGLELSPELRARLSGVAFRTRGPAPVGPLGRQLSRARGAGLEFAQYRGYVPGDAPRQIDWKLYARSDRLFVRESERDSPLSLVLVLDASASMAQVDQARPQWSRLHAARRLAACAMEVALREDERFGLLTLGDGAVQFIPPAAGRAQRDRCSLALAQLDARGRWLDAAALDAVAARIEPGALVLLLGDLFEPPAADWLARLAAAGREVAALRILTAEERDFPFRGPLRLQDAETGDWREVEADAVREGYLSAFASARRELALRLAAARVRFDEHWLDAAEDAALRRLFPAPGVRAA